MKENPRGTKNSLRRMIMRLKKSQCLGSNMRLPVACEFPNKISCPPLVCSAPHPKYLGHIMFNLRGYELRNGLRNADTYLLPVHTRWVLVCWRSKCGSSAVAVFLHTALLNFIIDRQLTDYHIIFTEFFFLSSSGPCFCHSEVDFTLSPALFAATSFHSCSKGTLV